MVSGSLRECNKLNIKTINCILYPYPFTPDHHASWSEHHSSRPLVSSRYKPSHLRVGLLTGPAARSCTNKQIIVITIYVASRKERSTGIPFPLPSSALLPEPGGLPMAQTAVLSRNTGQYFRIVCQERYNLPPADYLPNLCKLLHPRLSSMSKSDYARLPNASW